MIMLHTKQRKDLLRKNGLILQIRPINLLQFSHAPVQAHVQGHLLYWAEKPAYCKEGISVMYNKLRKLKKA